eukprot:gene4006-4339_t
MYGFPFAADYRKCSLAAGVELSAEPESATFPCSSLPGQMLYHCGDKRREGWES